MVDSLRVGLFIPSELARRGEARSSGVKPGPWGQPWVCARVNHA